MRNWPTSVESLPCHYSCLYPSHGGTCRLVVRSPVDPAVALLELPDGSGAMGMAGISEPLTPETVGGAAAGVSCTDVTALSGMYPWPICSCGCPPARLTAATTPWLVVLPPAVADV